MLLTTTDPAAHLTETLAGDVPNLTVSRIDPEVETQAYRDHILASKGASLDAQGRAMLEEDLRSPCTEEIAVFQAFSRVIREAGRKFVVMDTAPTGHTLLLDATGPYHRDLLWHAGENAARMTTPMMRLGMSITDTLMMGWIGPTALAAGAVVSDLYSLVFYLAAGILSMVAVLAARAVGAGERDGVRRAVHAGMAAALLMTLPAVTAVWYAADFVRLLGVDRSIPDLGRGYAHAMAITMLPMLLVAVWRNLFGALGRPRIFLVATFYALPLNALANLMLMFGWGPVPALGITGAGLASALVAFALLAGFATFTALDPEVRALRLFRLPSRPIFGDVREIFRFGLPVGVFTLGEVGLFLIATVVVSLFGAEALAAHAVALRMAGIVFAIPAGLSQAATVRVGTAIGRGNAGDLSRAVDSARTVGMASGIGICVGLAAGSGVIPALFVMPGGTVAATASTLLVLLGLLHLVQGLAGPATAILRAFKDTQRAMRLSLAGYWMLGMPGGALLGFGLNLGVFGIWCGLGVGALATAVLLNFRLSRTVLRPRKAIHFDEIDGNQAAT